MWVLFTVAALNDFPIAWVIALEVVLFAIYLLLVTIFSTPQRLAVHAQKLGWAHVGWTVDEAGFRDNLMKKGNAVARISWREKCVYLQDPFPAGPYANFDALEKEVGAYIVHF